MTDVTARFADSPVRAGAALHLPASVLSRSCLTCFRGTVVASRPALGIPGGRAGVTPDPAAISLGLIGLAAFLTMVLGMLSQAVVLYGAFQDMRGCQVNL